jgi:hypothetical protein
MRTSPSTHDATTTSTVGPANQPDRFPWLPILVLGFTWFLAVAIELNPASLLDAIAADLDKRNHSSQPRAPSPRPA